MKEGMVTSLVEALAPAPLELEPEEKELSLAFSLLLALGLAATAPLAVPPSDEVAEKKSISPGLLEACAEVGAKSALALLRSGSDFAAAADSGAKKPGPGAAAAAKEFGATSGLGAGAAAGAKEPGPRSAGADCENKPGFEADCSAAEPAEFAAEGENEFAFSETAELVGSSLSRD